MERNLENLYHRYLHGGVEMVEVHHNGADTFMRAIPEVKSRLEAAYVTRNNGIKGLKAYGGTPVKHKQDKLWGRYVPCEYVQGTGTQYIDTGIKITSDDEVYLDGCATVAASTFLLSQGLSTNNQAYQLANTANDELVFDIQNYTSYRVNTGVSARNTIRKIHIKNREIFVDGVSKGASTGTLANPADTAKLMYSASGSSAQRAKIAKFIVVGKCDLVAVKDVVDNVYGLWDRVNNKFYGNAGTGAFSGGELIQPISYAESTGTQYVDTGYTFENSTKIEFTFIKTGANQGYTDTESRGNVWFGTNGSTGAELMLGWGTNGNTNYFRGIGGTVFDSWKPSLNTKYHIEFTYEKDNGQLYVDGVKKGDTARTTNSTIGSTILLFAVRDNFETILYGKIKLYNEVKIWNGNTLLAHYLPIRIGTSVELLDLVSWSFATRVGTFTAGADIPYSQLCPDIIKVNSGDIRYGIGKNLFDTNTSNWLSGTYNYIKVCEEGEDAYMTLFEKDPTVSLSGVYLGFTRTGKDATGGNVIWHIDDGRIVSTSKSNLITGIKYGYVSIYGRQGFADAWDKLTRHYNIMVVKGSTAPTEYEPYAKTIRTNGTHKVIVGSQGVVDLGTLNLVKHGTEHGVWSVTLTGRASGITNLLLTGTNYSLASDQSISTMTNMTYKGHPSTSLFYIRDDNAYDNMTAAEFKAAMSGKLLFYQRTTDASFVAPQIRDIPMLLSTDSNLDVQSGVKTEMWGVKVFDGTENWGYGGNSSGYGFYLTIADCKTSGKTKDDIFCTHLPTRTASGSYTQNPSIGYFNPDSNSFTVRDDQFLDGASVAHWKAYLASEYAAGHPVIVLYPLATPATEQVTIAPVTSARRTTYVADSDSELGKTSIELDFLGKFGTSQTFLTSDGKRFILSDGKIFKVQQ